MVFGWLLDIVVTDLFHAFLDRFAKATRLDNLCRTFAFRYRRNLIEIPFLSMVFSSELYGVHINGMGNFIEVTFNGEMTLWCPVPAHGTRDWFVRMDCIGFKSNVRNPRIHRERFCSDCCGHCQAMRTVRT